MGLVRGGGACYFYRREEIPMIKQVNWSDHAEQLLTEALPDAMILSLVKAEVQRGVSQLYHCKDSAHEGYAVMRVDNNPTDWVIVGYAGSGARHFWPMFQQLADARHLSMRTHTISPIVQRLLRPLGFEWNGERVLRRGAR